MEKYRLKNGITVIFEKNSSKSVAVEIMFKVGSNFETLKLAGISHFLEHMLFEGTKKRKGSRKIANEVEKYGGDFNAYTTGDRTAFFIKIINNKFDTALDILSDMTANPLFDEKIMEKEKKVVIKEIHMVTDDLRLHQWILFHKILFEKHPAKNPTYGRADSVKNFTRDNIFNYYKTHYVPNNMIISIVGNASDVKDQIEGYFGNLKSKKLTTRDIVKEPLQTSIKKSTEKRDAINAYMVLGYKTIPRLDKASYALDVINAILGRGQSGWIFDEIRNKRGLAYQVGVNAEHETDYGVFAVYTNLDKKNINKAKSIILKQFKRLQSISKKELEEAKTFIEGNNALMMEDNFHRADNYAVWETIKDASLAKTYISKIKKVTVNDVQKVAKKYLNDNYTIITIEPKK